MIHIPDGRVAMWLCNWDDCENETIITPDAYEVWKVAMFLEENGSDSEQ